MVFAAQPEMEEVRLVSSQQVLIHHHFYHFSAITVLLCSLSIPLPPPSHSSKASLHLQRKEVQQARAVEAGSGWMGGIGCRHSKLLQTFFAPALVMLPGRLPTVGPIYLICALELQELCFDSCSEERRCRK